MRAQSSILWPPPEMMMHSRDSVARRLFLRTSGGGAVPMDLNSPIPNLGRASSDVALHSSRVRSPTARPYCSSSLVHPSHCWRSGTILRLKLVLLYLKAPPVTVHLHSYAPWVSGLCLKRLELKRSDPDLRRVRLRWSAEPGVLRRPAEPQRLEKRASEP